MSTVVVLLEMCIISTSVAKLQFIHHLKVQNYFKNEVFSKGTWKTGVTKLSYWQGAILVSSGVTILIVFILKWANILAF